MPEIITLRVPGHPNEFVRYSSDDPIAIDLLQKAAEAEAVKPAPEADTVRQPRKYKDKR